MGEYYVAAGGLSTFNGRNEPLVPEDQISGTN